MLAAIANSRTADAVAASGNPSALPAALTEGFQSAFLGGAVLAVGGLLLTLIVIRVRDSRAHQGPDAPAVIERSAQTNG